MKMQKNKTLAIVTTIILLFSIATSLALMPPASSHTPEWTIPTFPHIFAATNPIGIGQKATIYIWLTPTYADELITNDYRFHNYKLVITAPDGEVTEQNFETVIDTTSNQGASFVPDQVGVYNLTFIFPGQKVNDYSHSPTSQYINDTYAAGTASTTLTVQQDPIEEISYPPLPTEYWTRPIFGENVAWYLVSSNWLGVGMPGYGGYQTPNTRVFSGDSVGSQTGHIMWLKSIGQPGGVAGGNNFEILGNTWFEGTAYSQRYTNPIIVAGMLVYREPFESTGTAGDTVCVNLYTGEEIWRNPDLPSFSFAYVQDMENPDYHGVRPAYLCTNNFAQVYDAATGTSVWNTTGVPSGTTYVGSNGEQMRYIFYNNGTNSNPDYYLCLWNSSNFWLSTVANTERQLHTDTGSATPSRTTTITVPADKAYMYNYLDPNTQNVSIPWRNNQAGSPSILAVLPGDLLLCRNGSYPTSLAPTGNNPYNYFAVNLNASVGHIGNVLWWNTVQPAIDPIYGNITVITFGGASQSGFCESYRQTQQFAFFNIRTGVFIKLSDPQAALDYYGSTGPGTRDNVIAFDRCYSGAYSGIEYCYDMATGDLLWTYGNGGPGNTTNSGLEVPGPYPIFINAIGGHDLTDGIIYTIVTEHTFVTPIYKQALTRALNASDGSEIYTLTAATGEFGAGSFAIADGYTNFFNSYDSRIYTLGRGPSYTTVAVGPKSSTIGGNVVIEGTVNDVSVGLQTTEIQGRFPAGVPVASDSSMRDWMAYVYQQQVKPSNFIGVNVRLVILDSNGNYQDLGTTTTDSKGQYSMSWTPTIPGDFQVFAYFDGTNGYWPSDAETTFNMAEAPATPTSAPTAAPSVADQYFLPMATVLLVAIVIVIALVALMMRKRP